MILSNLIGLKWVGSISLQDADILAMYGKRSEKVLDFGVGGSTLILAQTCKDVTAVETNPSWIDRVSARAQTVGCRENIKFFTMNGIFESPPSFNTFDFVFIDGVPSERLPFARQAWKWLKVGGTMAFHDANRWAEGVGIREFAGNMDYNISRCDFMPPASDGKRSNLALFVKSANKPALPHEPIDWAESEMLNGRPKWSLGKTGDVVTMWEYKPEEWTN